MNIEEGIEEHHLTPEMLLRYLTGDDDEIDTLIMCKPKDVHITTTDHNIYQALGSVKDAKEIRLNKLTKLLEVVDVKSFRDIYKRDKIILREERVEELRKKAFEEE